MQLREKRGQNRGLPGPSAAEGVGAVVGGTNSSALCKAVPATELEQRNPAPVSIVYTTTTLSMACLNPLVPALHPKQCLAAQPGATMAE